MGPIEFGMLMVLLLAAMLVYKAKTITMALQLREKMVPVVRDIMNDDKLPPSIKMCAIQAFYGSTSTEFPRFLMRNLFSKPEESDFKELSVEHQKVVSDLIREHFFKVNLVAAAHWYALLAILTFTLYLLSILWAFVRRNGNGLGVATKLERAIMHPNYK